MHCQEIEMRWRKNPKNFKIHRPYNRNVANVEFNNKSDTSNNRGNYNHPIIQKVPELHIGIARRKEATENILTGHCEPTSESIDWNKQNVCH
jgi:hypothetical protein